MLKIDETAILFPCQVEIDKKKSFSFTVIPISFLPFTIYYELIKKISIQTNENIQSYNLFRLKHVRVNISNVSYCCSLCNTSRTPNCTTQYSI